MLTQKAKYGLKALGHLAKEYGNGPVLIALIAKEQSIPLKFLENILLLLKNEGIVASKKGIGGGYFLLKTPYETNLVTVLRIVNGPIAMLPCVSLNFYEKCKDCNEKKCNLNPIFAAVRDATLAIFENKTLADLV